MQHVYVPGKNESAPTFLLLHGTGGTERDLLPIADAIDPSASVLGVRGNVLENGMPRFFRRIAEGVFDEEDLVFRTKELYAFIDEASDQYHFDRNHVIAIGYSNGANVAASLLYHYDDALCGAILLHAMPPFRNVTLPNLDGTPVFIAAGKQDPLIPAAQTTELSQALQQARADVTEYWTDEGHQLVRMEIEQAKQWYETQFVTE